MDNMIMNSGVDKVHAQHLYWMFKRVWQCNMRINPKKCTFVVRINKFLGFYLTNKELKPSLINVKASASNKDIERLNDMLTVLNVFIFIFRSISFTFLHEA